MGLSRHFFVLCLWPVPGAGFAGKGGKAPLVLAGDFYSALGRAGPGLHADFQGDVESGGGD